MINPYGHNIHSVSREIIDGAYARFMEGPIPDTFVRAFEDPTPPNHLIFSGEDVTGRGDRDDGKVFGSYPPLGYAAVFLSIDASQEPPTETLFVLDRVSAGWPRMGLCRFDEDGTTFTRDKGGIYCGSQPHKRMARYTFIRVGQIVVEPKYLG